MIFFNGQYFKLSIDILKRNVIFSTILPEVFYFFMSWRPPVLYYWCVCVCVFVHFCLCVHLYPSTVKVSSVYNGVLSVRINDLVL